MSSNKSELISYIDIDIMTWLECTRTDSHEFDLKYTILSKRSFKDLCDKIRHHFETDPRLRGQKIVPSAFWIKISDIHFKTCESDNQIYNMYLFGGTQYALSSMTTFNDECSKIKTNINAFRKCLDDDLWEF